jgi:hypothetical protein
MFQTLFSLVSSRELSYLSFFQWLVELISGWYITFISMDGEIGRDSLSLWSQRYYHLSRFKTSRSHIASRWLFFQPGWGATSEVCSTTKIWCRNDIQLVMFYNIIKKYVGSAKTNWSLKLKELILKPNFDFNSILKVANNDCELKAIMVKSFPKTCSNTLCNELFYEFWWNRFIKFGIFSDEYISAGA